MNFKLMENNMDPKKQYIPVTIGGESTQLSAGITPFSGNSINGQGAIGITYNNYS
jgi:hypothetical protein